MGARVPHSAVWSLERSKVKPVVFFLWYSLPYALEQGLNALRVLLLNQKTSQHCSTIGARINDKKPSPFCKSTSLRLFKGFRLSATKRNCSLNGVSCFNTRGLFLNAHSYNSRLVPQADRRVRSQVASFVELECTFVILLKSQNSF